MSELEKQQREVYQKNRRKWIYIQAAIIIVLTVATILSAIVYSSLNKHTYVSYTQDGNAIYKAYLADNEFYSEEYLNGSHAYVAKIVDKMTADFSYCMQMNADKVDFKYTYKIDAQLEIKDGQSGAAIYNPVYEIVPEQSKTVDDKNGISIKESVEIDYHKYNDIANRFVAAYALKGTENTLIVRMYVEVVGVSEAFEGDSAEQYTVSVYVPLSEEIIKPEVVSTVPAGEQKVLANSSNSKLGFKIAAIVCGSLDVAAAVALGLFIVLTRDRHIDYARRVQKIISNYKSYIQKINNSFDTEGYQVLMVDTFREMLEIRDTIQRPILMFEDGDKTYSHFMIPTDTKVLYMFEVKVEPEVAEETPVHEEPEIEAPIAEVETAEPVVIEESTPEPEGVEVISVEWPESQGKIYRYDPDGETLAEGDVVLVPTSDKENDREIDREATVVWGNHRVDPATLKHPLKKIIKVVRRKIENYLKK